MISEDDLISMIETGVISRFDSNKNQIHPHEFDDDDFAKEGEDGFWRWPLIQNLPGNFEIEQGAFGLRIDELYTRQSNQKPLEFYVSKCNVGPRLMRRANASGVFRLVPSITYITSTIERINLPDNIMAIVQPVDILLESSISISLKYLRPGFYGKVELTLLNNSGNDMIIERGFRIAQIYFFQTT